MIRASAKNHGSVARRVRPRPLRLPARRDRRVGRRRRRDARRARRRGVRAHGRVRHRDRELVHRGRSAARAPAARLRQGHRPRLRREPAPVSRLLPRDRRPSPPALDGHPALGQAALVQQPARRRHGVAHGRGVQPAGLRDRQARQPVRRQPRRDDRGGLRARLRRRPGLGLRRHRRAQPARCRRRSRASLAERFVEALHAPGFAPEVLAALAAKNDARPRHAGAPARHARRARVPPRDRRPARPGSRQRERGSLGHGGRRAPRRRPRSSGATCCSPGASPSTSTRTRSCSRAA